MSLGILVAKHPTKTHDSRAWKFRIQSKNASLHLAAESITARAQNHCKAFCQPNRCFGVVHQVARVLCSCTAETCQQTCQGRSEGVAR